MSNLHRYLLAVATVGLISATVQGQNIISAKSGMVHYLEGDVFLDGKAVEVKYNLFPEIKEGQVVRTDEGRIEVLMNPGTFLRLGEHSSFKMLDKRLIDTRFEVLEGSAIIEVAEVAKDNNLTVAFKDAQVEVKKAGVYRIDGDTGELKVYKGEAIVVRNGQTLTVKESHLAQLKGVTITAEKFDAKMGDAFYRWAARRAGSTSVANLAAAKSMYDNGYSRQNYGQWAYNPYFGMFTYVPGFGSYYSPFGYYYYSPNNVNRIYDSYNNYGGGGGRGYTQSYNASNIDRSVGYNQSYGYTTAPRSSEVYSAPAASAPSAGGGSVRGGASAGGDSGAGRGGATSGRGR